MECVIDFYCPKPVSWHLKKAHKKPLPTAKEHAIRFSDLSCFNRPPITTALQSCIFGGKTKRRRNPRWRLIDRLPLCDLGLWFWPLFHTSFKCLPKVPILVEVLVSVESVLKIWKQLYTHSFGQMNAHLYHSFCLFRGRNMCQHSRLSHILRFAIQSGLGRKARWYRSTVYSISSHYDGLPCIVRWLWNYQYWWFRRRNSGRFIAFAHPQGQHFRQGRLEG